MNTRKLMKAFLLVVSVVVAPTGCNTMPPSRTALLPVQSPHVSASQISDRGAQAKPRKDQSIPAMPLSPQQQTRQAEQQQIVVRGQDSHLLPQATPQNPHAYGTTGQVPVAQAQATTPASPQAGMLSRPNDATNANFGGAGATAASLLPPPPDTTLPGSVSPLLQPQPYTDIDPTMSTPVDVYVEETQTGRFMFGAGVNSEAGVTGQIVIDERNFDITRFPTSFDDFVNGTAFRGAGQGFRLEAMPGTVVQRYLLSFTEPYLFNTQISLNTSAFLFDRRYFDWSEQRLGGRLALGYRLTHDLSLSAAIRAESVDIYDLRVTSIPELNALVGKNNLYSGRLTLTHDTRDIPFAPTAGHLIELSFEQVFGDFDYPRAEVDWRHYFLIRERPDGSGRHTLGLSARAGFTGSQTPIFENYFAGGYSTLRGFEYRGASPVVNTVRVGGEFRFLGSAEYLFPLTADDMLKGVLFVDVGTVEEKIEMHSDHFRVAPGFGLRINVPAMGPAPLAFDFAFPVAQADTDVEQVFSFFFGFGR